MAFNTTTCPETRTQEKFVQFLKVGASNQKFEFDHEIVWFHESESSVKFMHGGKLLKQGPTFNDYYGYLGSFSERNINDVMSIAADYGVTQESSLEIQLVVQLCQKPNIESEEDKISNAKVTHPGESRQYSFVPNDWRKAVKDDETGENLYLNIESVLAAEAVVWSSRNTPEQNAALANAFRETCGVVPSAP